eukprot:s7311_g1.t4
MEGACFHGLSSTRPSFTSPETTTRSGEAKRSQMPGVRYTTGLCAGGGAGSENLTEVKAPAAQRKLKDFLCSLPHPFAGLNVRCPAGPHIHRYCSLAVYHPGLRRHRRVRGSGSEDPEQCAPTRGQRGLAQMDGAHRLGLEQQRFIRQYLNTCVPRFDAGAVSVWNGLNVAKRPRLLSASRY